MKRFLSLLLIVTLVAGILAGCGALEPAGPTEPGNNTQPTTGTKPTTPSGNNNNNNPGNNTGNNGGNNNTNTPAVDVADDIVIKNDAEMFTDRDLAGTYEDAQTITLGNEILRTTTQHSTKVFIISCPEMVKGKTYTMIINGSSYKATAQ